MVAWERYWKYGYVWLSEEAHYIFANQEATFARYKKEKNAKQR